MKSTNSIMKPANSLYGMLYMILNGLSLSTLYALMKVLTKNMHSNQAVFLYKATIFILMLPWIFRKGLIVLKTPNLVLHIWRGLFSIAGSLLFMYGLKHVNVANATALHFLEQILWVVVGILYFKEGLTKIKISAILASFIGAILIVYPSLFGVLWELLISGKSDFSNDEFNYYYLFIIAAVIVWATNTTLVKVLGNKGATNETQAFYVLLFGVILAYPTAFVNWEVVEYSGIKMLSPQSFISFSEINIELWQWFYILLVAGCYFVHVTAFFLAMKCSEISTIMSFDYFKLIFSGIISILFFHDSPSIYAYCGYLIIIVAGLTLVKVEYHKRKSKNKSDTIENIEAELENV